MQEKLNKGIFFGMIGNLLFVAFGIICGIYYYTYQGGTLYSRSLEALAYSVEFLAFGVMAYSDYLLIASARFRKLMKISYTAYIILEALMMVLELNSYRVEVYQPYSLPLAMIHAVVSAAACFSFLQLDADNVRFEVVIVAVIAAILAGMLGNILGIRIYFGILTNAVAFSFLFGAIFYMKKNQFMDIDCYGDKATVAEFSSKSLFDDPEIEALGRTSKKSLKNKSEAETEPSGEEIPESDEEKAPEKAETSKSEVNIDVPIETKGEQKVTGGARSNKNSAKKADGPAGYRRNSAKKVNKPNNKK